MSLPSAMASSGAVVVGLSDTIRMRSQAVKALNPANRTSPIGGYWFTDLKQAYSFPTFKAYTGKGVTIGVLMETGYNPAT